jgi:hypothetical protein
MKFDPADIQSYFNLTLHTNSQSNALIEQTTSLVKFNLDFTIAIAQSLTDHQSIPSIDIIQPIDLKQ